MIMNHKTRRPKPERLIKRLRQDAKLARCFAPGLARRMRQAARTIQELLP
jgi:hypothetical protein